MGLGPGFMAVDDVVVVPLGHAISILLPREGRKRSTGTWVTCTSTNSRWEKLLSNCIWEQEGCASTCFTDATHH